MKKDQDNKLTEEVLEKIKKGDVKMRSRSYFIAQGVFLLSVFFLVILLAVYFTTFIFFILRVNNLILLTDFGWFGFSIIFSVLPWYILFFILFLMGLINFLYRKFYTGYRKPIIALMGLIVLIIFSLSVVVEKKLPHEELYNRAVEENLPMGGRMYRNLGNMEMENVIIGTIIEKNSDYLLIEDEKEEILRVIVSDPTSRHFRSLERVHRGESVFVVGELSGDEITAVGLKKVSPRRGRGE